MPLIIAGLSWLAGVLGTALIAFLGWMAAFVTKRIAFMLAAIAAMGVLAGLFVVSIEQLVNQLTLTMPVTANIGFLLPTNYATVISIYLASRILWWVYSVNWLIIRMRLM